MRKIVLCMIIGIMLKGVVFAGSGGTVIGDFLKLGINARAEGMGGAYAAVCDDVHAIYWNPAGLMQLEERELSASHLSYVALIDYENLQYAMPYKNGRVGCDIRFLHTIDERRDAAGNKLGEFADYNSAVTLGYAGALRENLYYGLNLKFIYMKLDTEQGNSFALDYGLLWKLTDRIKTGIVLQNAGLKMKLAGDESPLPLNMKLGISYLAVPDKLIVATDINIPLPGEYSVSLGTEYSPVNFFKMRAGYKHREQGNNLGGLDGFATGVGFGIKQYTLDYAYVPLGEFASTHRITLKTKF